MNAPLPNIKIQIDDATQRKARLYDAMQEGEVGAHKHDALTRMASLGAQTATNAALLLEGMSYWYGRLQTDGAQQKSKTLKDAATILRIEAGRGHDILSDIENGGNLYIGEA